MKSPARRARTSPRNFEAEYSAALADFAARSGEAALRRAYDLGRDAMEQRKSLVALASLHHDALRRQLARDSNPGRRLDLLASGSTFFTEILSPYEMAHRGFQEAVAALRRLNETLEEEIKRIAHAVHDEAGQLLVAVHLALAELARDIPSLHHDRLACIQRLLEEVELQLRRYSHELRPTILDDLGWIPAVRFLAARVAKRANLPVRFRFLVSGRLPPAVEIALYRVVQEALNNAVKHAKPAAIFIRASQRASVLRCSVEDDGVGFDLRAVQSSANRTGLGLIGMQERLNAVGGTLSILSLQGKGTKIVMEVPVEGKLSSPGSRRSRR